MQQGRVRVPLRTRPVPVYMPKGEERWSLPYYGRFGHKTVNALTAALAALKVLGKGNSAGWT